MKKLVLIGAGGFARTLSDIVRQTKQFDKIILLDDSKTDGVEGKCDTYAQYLDENTWFYPAISNNQVRHMWLDRLLAENANIATIIHPSAYVSPMADISEGVAILPGAIISTGCSVSFGALINCGSILDHDSKIGVCAHVATGAVAMALSIVADEAIVNR